MCMSHAHARVHMHTCTGYQGPRRRRRGWWRAVALRRPSTARAVAYLCARLAASPVLHPAGVCPAYLYALSLLLFTVL